LGNYGFIIALVKILQNMANSCPYGLLSHNPLSNISGNPRHRGQSTASSMYYGSLRAHQASCAFRAAKKKIASLIFIAGKVRDPALYVRKKY